MIRRGFSQPVLLFANGVNFFIRPLHSNCSPLEIINNAISQRGQEPRVNGIYHITNCPSSNHARGDLNPSIHYWEAIGDDGQATVHFKCWSGGCTRSEILKGFGVSGKLIPGIAAYERAQSPITLFDLAQYLKLDWEFLYNLGWEDCIATFHKADGTKYKRYGVKVPYYHADGSPHARFKLRIELGKGKTSPYVWSRRWGRNSLWTTVPPQCKRARQTRY